MKRWQEILGGPKLPLCDKPASKAALMAEMRKARKDAGLVRVEVWIKPESREGLKEYIRKHCI